jgi:hypothetical protein
MACTNAVCLAPTATFTHTDGDTSVMQVMPLPGEEFAWFAALFGWTAGAHVILTVWPRFALRNSASQRALAISLVSNALHPLVVNLIYPISGTCRWYEGYSWVLYIIKAIELFLTQMCALMSLALVSTPYLHPPSLPQIHTQRSRCICSSAAAAPFCAKLTVDIPGTGWAFLIEIRC